VSQVKRFAVLCICTVGNGTLPYRMLHFGREHQSNEKPKVDGYIPWVCKPLIVLTVTAGRERASALQQLGRYVWNRIWGGATSVCRMGMCVMHVLLVGKGPQCFAAFEDDSRTLTLNVGSRLNHLTSTERPLRSWRMGARGMHKL